MNVFRMNSLCDSVYLTDDSLHELSDIPDFFLTSSMTSDHIKTEPADVIDQVRGHVTP